MASPSPVFLLGEILWINFPQRLLPGHEQFGRRPVVVVAVPEAIQSIPYRVLLVVPLTRTRFSGPLFPLLQAGTGGLPTDSSALIYQLGAFDVRRVCGRLGMLSDEDLLPLKQGLKLLFGFDSDSDGDTPQ